MLVNSIPAGGAHFMARADIHIATELLEAIQRIGYLTIIVNDQELLCPGSSAPEASTHPPYLSFRSGRAINPKDNATWPIKNVRLNDATPGEIIAAGISGRQRHENWGADCMGGRLVRSMWFIATVWITFSD